MLRRLRPAGHVHRIDQATQIDGHILTGVTRSRCGVLATHGNTRIISGVGKHGSSIASDQKTHGFLHGNCEAIGHGESCCKVADAVGAFTSGD